MIGVCVCVNGRVRRVSVGMLRSLVDCRVGWIYVKIVCIKKGKSGLWRGFLLMNRLIHCRNTHLATRKKSTKSSKEK